MKFLPTIGFVIFTSLSGAQRLANNVAGFDVRTYRSGINRYDDRQRLWLYSSGDCDGAHLRLVLSTDPIAILINDGYDPKSEPFLAPGERRFNLQKDGSKLVPGFSGEPWFSEFGTPWGRRKIESTNGLGIRIGMTKSEVLRIAGRPSKKLFSKKFDCEELVYKRVTWDRDPRGRIKTYEGSNVGTQLTNYYLFRNDRLFFIEASQDFLGGA